MKRLTITSIISFFFVCLFLYTGISKLIDFPLFKEQIALSPLLEPIASWIALILPASEIIVAIVLFLPATRLKGLYISLLFMVLFTMYIIYILVYNETLPCTCGGVLQELSWPQHIVFNIICIAMISIAILLKRKVGASSSKVTPSMVQDAHI